MEEALGAAGVPQAYDRVAGVLAAEEAQARIRWVVRVLCVRVPCVCVHVHVCCVLRKRRRGSGGWCACCACVCCECVRVRACLLCAVCVWEWVGEWVQAQPCPAAK